MKQQNEDNTELYRRLRGSFEMSPEQMQRVRQEILQRTGGENAAPAAITQHRAFSGRTLAKRLIPAAACLLLAAGGGIFLHFRSAELTDSFTQQSSVMMDEQTAVPSETGTTAGQTTTRQTTTLTMTTTQTTEQTRMQTTELTTGQTTEQTAGQTTKQTTSQTAEQTTGQSENTDTESVQTEMNDVTQLQHDTETIADAQETTSVSVSTTVTMFTADATTQTGTTEPTTENADGKCVVSMQNVTGTAGQTVSVGLILTEDTAFAGYQIRVEMHNHADVPPLVVIGCESCLEDIIFNSNAPSEGSPAVAMVFAQGSNIVFPAGSTLLTLMFQIPDDAEPGTEYQLEMKDVIFSSEDISHLPVEVHSGGITVAE